MLKRRLAATACVAAVSGAFVPAAALADQPGAASQVAQDVSGGAGLQLEEVVVTARKRQERLQDVPISANVTSGASLEKRDITALGQMDRYVPNLFIQQTPANQAVYIRGIGSSAGNLAFEQSVGLFVDGIYAGRGRQFAAPFLDLERVEVLRGPQGALFGKNTSAGAINITSRGPTTAFEASSELNATVTGQPGFDLTQIVSGPITDTLGARVAVRYADNDGWLKNGTTNQSEPHNKTALARLTLDWAPIDRLNVRLKVEGARIELEGQPMSTVAPGHGLTFTRATTPGAPDYDNTNSFDTALTANYQMGGFTLTSITGYSKYNYAKVIDSDFTAASILNSSFIEAFEQTSQELRLTSPTSGRLKYVVGVYYHHNTVDLTQGTGIQLGPLNGTSNRIFSQDDDTVSLYGQASYDLTSALRATVGLRQTWDDKSADQTRANTGRVPPSWIATPLSGSRHETAFDPSAQLQYTFNPDAMVYVSYAQGSKAGGFVAAQSTTTQSQFQFEGERAKSWEVGAKLQMLDRRVRLNVALFDTKYDDLQVSVWNPQAAAFITGNAASATTKGVEVELGARLTRSLDLSFSGGYLDAMYDDFPGAGCIYPLPVIPAGLACVQNIGGTRIPRAPRWSMASTLDLNQPLTDGLNLVGSLTVSYRSEAFLEDTLNPVSLQPAYAKVDLRLGIAGARDRWELAVVGKNLTDKLTASHAFGTPFVTGSETYVVDPPRVIALQARLRY